MVEYINARYNSTTHDTPNVPNYMVQNVANNDQKANPFFIPSQPPTVQQQSQFQQPQQPPLQYQEQPHQPVAPSHRYSLDNRMPPQQQQYIPRVPAPAPSPDSSIRACQPLAVPTENIIGSPLSMELAEQLPPSQSSQEATAVSRQTIDSNQSRRSSVGQHLANYHFPEKGPTSDDADVFNMYYAHRPSLEERRRSSVEERTSVSGDREGVNAQQKQQQQQEERLPPPLYQQEPQQQQPHDNQQLTTRQSMLRGSSPPPPQRRSSSSLATSSSSSGNEPYFYYFDHPNEARSSLDLLTNSISSSRQPNTSYETENDFYPRRSSVYSLDNRPPSYSSRRPSSTASQSTTVVDPFPSAQELEELPNLRPKRRPRRYSIGSIPYHMSSNTSTAAPAAAVTTDTAVNPSAMATMSTPSMTTTTTTVEEAPAPRRSSFSLFRRRKSRSSLDNPTTTTSRTSMSSTSDVVDPNLGFPANTSTSGDILNRRLSGVYYPPPSQQQSHLPDIETSVSHLDPRLSETRYVIQDQKELLESIYGKPDNSGMRWQNEVENVLDKNKRYDREKGPQKRGIIY